MMSFRRNIVVLSSVWALGLGTMPAHAVEPTQADKDAAKKLYDEAAREVDLGDLASACGKFADALRLLPGHVRTAISLGSCMDKWGKTASALQHYANARTWAREQGKTDKIAEIDSLIGALAPRLSRLTIQVPAPWATWAGMQVFRDDKRVDVATWGNPEVLDPGTYTISATALGQLKWTTLVEVKQGQSAEVSVAPAWKEPEKSAERVLGFIGLGLGGAALVTGGILAGVSVAKENESKTVGGCAGQNPCNPQGEALHQQSQQFGNASIGFFIAGGVLAAGGLTLVLLSRSSAKTGASATSAQVIVRPFGAALSTNW